MSSTPESSKIRRPLTRDRVIEGAIELADQVGVHPLTIRKLAAHLGVKPMSIYHHVANKDDILDGMVDSIFGLIELPGDDAGSWREAMRRRAVSARTVLRAHPWAAAMMDSRTAPGPNTLRHHDALLGSCRSAGFTLAMTGHAVAVLDAFVFGYALQEAALPFDDADEIPALVEESLGNLSADDYPHLAEFTTGYVLRPGYDFGDEFDFGLGLVLDGLERAAATT